LRIGVHTAAEQRDGQHSAVIGKCTAFFTIAM
jgi:hypothetical protein